MQNLEGENCLVVPPVRIIARAFHYLHVSMGVFPCNFLVDKGTGLIWVTRHWPNIYMKRHWPNLGEEALA